MCWYSMCSPSDQTFFIYQVSMTHYRILNVKDSSQLRCHFAKVDNKCILEGEIQTLLVHNYCRNNANYMSAGRDRLAQVFLNPLLQQPKSASLQQRNFHYRNTSTQFFLQWLTILFTHVLRKMELPWYNIVSHSSSSIPFPWLSVRPGPLRFGGVADSRNYPTEHFQKH